MSYLSQSVKFIRRAAVLMLLPLLVSSCQWMKEDFDDELADSSAAQYINLTLHVRSSETVTRSTPNGGEDGDGREKGIETRENEVDGVTLILYQNDNGINASAESAAATPIDFAAYYTTTRLVGEANDRYNGELCYTTGEQELDTRLDITKTYHMLVVANANLTGSITVGNASATSLANVRDMLYATAYTGTGVAVDASKFVMSSEEDDVLTFSNYSYDKTTNRIIYSFDNIHIERLAARIDYWAKNATYKTTYDHNGYEYAVTGSTSDKFVLTSITPFNLNMGTGNEYLFKRTNNSSSPYLANETTTNWVIDPYTASKTAAAHPDYLRSPLTSVSSDMTGTYNVTMEGQQGNKQSESSSDIVILAYPKENTLTASTPLYYYATGLAFEGYYYKNGATTGGERHVYYYYIRHQGESDLAYDAMKAGDLSSTATMGSTTSMNYGIVRNNIYRVSVENISIGGWIKIAIEEKPWRHVDNPAIYI